MHLPNGTCEYGKKERKENLACMMKTHLGLDVGGERRMKVDDERREARGIKGVRKGLYLGVMFDACCLGEAYREVEWGGSDAIVAVLAGTLVDVESCSKPGDPAGLYSS